MLATLDNNSMAVLSLLIAVSQVGYIFCRYPSTCSCARLFPFTMVIVVEEEHAAPNKA